MPVAPSAVRAAVAAMVVAAAAGLVACGSGGGGGGGRSGEASAVRIALTDDGCSPARVAVPAGPTTFKVSNEGSGAVTELEVKDAKGIILGERENVVPGISGSFSLTLAPGRYALSCPNGGAHADGVLTVTGTPRAQPRAADPALARAAAGWRAYARRETAALVRSTEGFAAAVEDGDVAGAKARFASTRAHYERIEPVAEAFGGLDPAIDARVDDVPSPARWSGFHRIERALWQDGTTAGADPYARRLVRDVRALHRRVAGLRFQPAQLANGAVELLNEVASSKITGEEDRYSHTDLSDFQANLDGARTAFAPLQPGLAHRDAALARTLSAPLRGRPVRARPLPPVDALGLRDLHRPDPGRPPRARRRGRRPGRAPLHGGREGHGVARWAAG